KTSKKSSGDDNNSNSTGKYILIALIIIVVIVVFLLILRSCSNSGDVDTTTSSATTTTQQVVTTKPDDDKTTVPTTTTTTKPTTQETTTNPTTTTATTTKPTTTTTTTTKPTTTTTKKPTTTTTTTKPATTGPGQNQNNGLIVNGVYRSTDGRFTLNTPGWKTSSNQNIVPEDYAGGPDNTILITKGAYQQTDYWTKELYESFYGIAIVGDLEKITLNSGVSCTKFVANNSSGVKEYYYIFQTPMSSGIDAAKYCIRFMQASGKPDMGDIANQIMASISFN
ncbi:MAG: hypothetical protein IKY44_04595, partial [Clostridia bacterium]|nr:hypothetical protein [Clostridia bacterium]